ncbi:hypothetical protein [Fibrobacter sp. UWEL]|uniref:hypothetical protein n=1 Tax=Fibrobacter sp. UWEL TaxID=1896209 RepID=UPI000918B61E|nr:hypothetical protein [Fibrobacter sp. UWEL]SHL38045.1 hypothetical protein SAMN05720468_1256 [Fibrobacter sp. UWEL]
MKKNFPLSFVFGIFLACSEGGDPQNEVIFVNDTENNILFLWKCADCDVFDTIPISPKDSAYAIGDHRFPLLQENGLRSSEKDALYHVRLVFEFNEERKCLFYEKDNLIEGDIRDLKSFENIGECNFCVLRNDAIPDGMVYHITKEMLDQAVPCE